MKSKHFVDIINDRPQKQKQKNQKNYRINEIERSEHFCSK